jgi:photosystem II stability/assembly factor-like uncharacterized protein
MKFTGCKIAVLFLVLPCLMFTQGWFGQNSGTNKSLFDVHFADSQNGWIASMTNTILYTSDGGQNWTDLQPSPSVNYWGIYFVSTQEGWAVGSPGKIRHTTDAGATWEDQTGGAYNNWDVYFLDENNGWIAGGREQGFPGQDPIRYIYHTTNGGDVWSSQLYDNNEPQLWAVHFLNANIGYAVGDAGTIFHTKDGGSDWFEQTSGAVHHLRSVHATTPDTAWAVGVQGLVLRTVNGGSTWDSVYVGTSHGFGRVYFVDAMTGWIAGGDVTEGTIAYTTDGGGHWELQSNAAQNGLYSLYFTDADTGWAVGYNGTIIHTTTGGTALEEVRDFVASRSEVVLSQNSPNPFNSTTNISFILPKSQHVKLSVYDLIGQEVVVLVDGEMRAGEHSVNFDGQNLPDGVYFYRLSAGNVTRTKICVLLK